MTMIDKEKFGQTVLVLQGGGALGAYQVGVFQALHEAGVAVDWVIGTSIGAINASLIAGSAPDDRLAKMTEFWRRVERLSYVPGPFPAWITAAARNMLAVTTGVPSFFTPQPAAFLSQHAPLGPEDAGYYSVAPLKETLTDLVDFDRINNGPTRLTVGASNVNTGQMTYFDSRDMKIDVRHVMASGALPPAFPAVRIDGDLYWDGGILSNTPVEAVFDDNPRRNALIFAVHLWNAEGREPETIWEVMNRQKDLQYSSRAVSHVQRQRQIHNLRSVVSELVDLLPPELRKDNRVAELASYGCRTRMHVVRLLVPALDNEDHSKDIDFSPRGIAERRDAGYAHTREMLDKRPWEAPVPEHEGFVLHEACGGEMTAPIGGM
ncbi:MAG: patatin-like phospholipase family protein [Sphingomonas sp.]|nr:patatin [Zymomonas sp.]MBA4773660.1 patatin-like phospholipase family protein [Sphingomonas sp.]